MGERDFTKIKANTFMNLSNSWALDGHYVLIAFIT